VIECVTHTWVPRFVMVVMDTVGLGLCVTSTTTVSMITTVSKLSWLG